MRTRALVNIVVSAIPLLLMGCTWASLPQLKTSSLSPIVPPNQSATVPVAPIEVYQRIATSASRCWFGPDGPLRYSHIFHAIVQAPADGGLVEIGIHKRTTNQKSPWGAKIYAIVLKGTTSTDLVFQNFGLDLKTRNAIKTDALAWANGKPACTDNVAPQLPPEAVVPRTRGSQRRTPKQ